jgi:hypothetical protein
MAKMESILVAMMISFRSSFWKNRELDVITSTDGLYVCGETQTDRQWRACHRYLRDGQQLGASGADNAPSLITFCLDVQAEFMPYDKLEKEIRPAQFEGTTNVSFHNVS